MQITHIGKENSTFQQFFALKNNRNKRLHMGQFFVEGVQNIKNAISNDWHIVAFVFSQDKELSKWAKSILHFSDINYALSSELMNKLSDKTDTSEILAIIEMKEELNIFNTKNPVYVLLDRPSKKGNLGSIIRSCDALNVDCLFYSGHSVDIYDHEVITASMGSFFRVPFCYIETNEQYLRFISNLKTMYKDFQVVATSLQAEDKIQDCDFTKPTLLLIGNEGDGLCKFYKENADKSIIIPIKKDIDSLNVACATSICLYEIQRQRGFMKI